MATPPTSIRLRTTRLEPGWRKNWAAGKRAAARIKRATESGDLRRALWYAKILYAHSPGSREARAAKAQALQAMGEVAKTR